jgi:parallel beta-helix repeat protein
MIGKAASVMMCVSLLISMLTIALDIKPVEANPAIINVPEDCSTIQAAINTANLGDTINVSSGTYRENVVLNKTVSLIGENKHNTVIDGSGTGNVINVTANDVSISGFTIRNSGTLSWVDCGIHVYYQSYGNNISDNILTNNSVGVFLDGSRNNALANNYAESNWPIDICLFCSDNNVLAGNDVKSIGMGGSNNNILIGNNASSNIGGIGIQAGGFNNTYINNTASNNRIGIRLSGCNNVLMGNNVSFNDEAGIHLMTEPNPETPCEHNILIGNIASNTLSVWGDGIRVDFCNNNTITNNVVSSNNGYGIDLSGSSNDTITNNTILLNNQAGIRLGTYGEAVNDRYFSKNNTLIGNTISSNYYYGILLERSNGNKVFHNEFINNMAVQAISASPEYVNTWDDGYPSGGNYWSDYTGADLYSGLYQNEIGHDGIGDTPYVIDSNNQDNYPLVKPWEFIGNETIYIRADGSVYPSGAPVHREEDLYALTDSITSDADGIVVERNDIIFDGGGYSIQGYGVGNGFSLFGIHNFTLENTNIQSFMNGTCLVSSSNNTIIRNNITDTLMGFFLSSSFNNTLSGNNVTANVGYGVWGISSSYNDVSENIIATKDRIYSGIAFCSSSNNTMMSNDVTGNSEGIRLEGSSNCSIVGNSITANAVGIQLSDSSDSNIFFENSIVDNSFGIRFISLPDSLPCSGNKFYHNNLANNAQQVELSTSSAIATVWDDGYPSGGNYWSDYNGADLHNGPHQDVTGSDGVGDTPYVIDGVNQDNYPFMSLNGWLTYPISTESNVTITDMRADEYSLNFTASGPIGETGYVNATVPVGLNATDITVFVDDVQPSPPFPTITSNGTHYFVYFEFTLSTHDISIQYKRTILGDVNADGVVDSTDLGILGSAWGSFKGDPNYISEADINEDSVVDSSDLGIMGAHWGETE